MADEGEPSPEVESRGEKTELLTTPAVGVADPDAVGVPVLVGNEVVEANRLDKDALERRYGRVREDRGDLPPARRSLGNVRDDSEVVCCGNCRGWSVEEVMSAADVPSWDASWY